MAEAEAGIHAPLMSAGRLPKRRPPRPKPQPLRPPRSRSRRRAAVGQPATAACGLTSSLFVFRPARLARPLDGRKSRACPKEEALSATPEEAAEAWGAWGRGKHDGP